MLVCTNRLSLQTFGHLCKDLPNFITFDITNLWQQLRYSFVVCKCALLDKFSPLRIFSIIINIIHNIHSNLLPLLNISTPKNLSSIKQFLPIHINLGVLMRKRDEETNKYDDI